MLPKGKVFGLTTYRLTASEITKLLKDNDCINFDFYHWTLHREKAIEFIEQQKSQKKISKSYLRKNSCYDAEGR